MLTTLSNTRAVWVENVVTLTNYHTPDLHPKGHANGSEVPLHGWALCRSKYLSLEQG